MCYRHSSYIHLLVRKVVFYGVVGYVLCDGIFGMRDNKVFRGLERDPGGDWSLIKFHVFLQVSTSKIFCNDLKILCNESLGNILLSRSPFLQWDFCELGYFFFLIALVFFHFLPNESNGFYQNNVLQTVAKIQAC